MATSINQGSIQISANVVLNDPVGQNAVDTATLPVAFTVNETISNGTGADQANKVYKDNRTLAASASESLDLFTGALKDAFGNAIVLGKILAIIIKAAKGNTNNVQVGAAGANAFTAPFDAGTSYVSLKPGGTLVLIAPDATGYVVDTTHKLLAITNSAGTTGVTYDIIIIGN